MSRGDETTTEPADTWLDKHIKLGRCQKGEKITVLFPLRKMKTVERAVDQEFEVEWQGDDVVDITPPGKYDPFYNNRKIFDKAPMKEGVFRHVEHEFHW